MHHSWLRTRLSCLLLTLPMLGCAGLRQAADEISTTTSTTAKSVSTTISQAAEKMANYVNESVKEAVKRANAPLGQYPEDYAYLPPSPDVGG
ncbi:hypothetical protein [Parvibium lacunae]|uniref:Lipoprotein n=1 Tax=Parvibium lacunae TaxID=1888893 RepID=A0A368L0U5_9BURK|nr:hypothetical protein [Parvibium lacunae]RCS57065.1 hypothetical protein DU000_09670 [Parvibium lacunae]